MHQKGSDGQDNFRKSVEEKKEEKEEKGGGGGVMVDWWRSYEAVKRNVTPGHFPHCGTQCKVRLAGPQGALTPSLLPW